MKRLLGVIICCLVALVGRQDSFAQPMAGTIEGVVVDAKTGTPMESVHMGLEGTKTGATTDSTGRFVLENVPVGRHTLVASFVGYDTERVVVDLLERGAVRGLVVQLAPSSVLLDQVIITATRTERLRSEVPVIVNVIDDFVFESTQALSLSEGLSFQPGLRLEIDCQTCNYSQIRLNGLAGSYSQILIDSRPIFSALNGLYGLDQIPTSMIERVEVIRGGGSALFGASAIAGTLNIITREPVENSSSVSYHQGLIDGSTPDGALSANASLVSDDRQSGVFLFGILRNRSAYDTNGDGFSEMPFMRNNSFGLRAYHKPGALGKLTIEAHSLTEERQGGNQIGKAAHLADQGEYRLHRVTGGGITYEQYLPARKDKISVYISGQYTGRDHYTGIDHVDAYGDTKNVTLVGGIQYSRTIPKMPLGISNTITMGTELQYDEVTDEIPIYDRFIDQTVRQLGAYVQTDWKVSPVLTLLLGGRLDRHSALGGPVFSPRVNALLGLAKGWQLRGTYATGFRAPQAFDADLHIAFAGGGVSFIRLSDYLKREDSRSYSTSLDYNYTHDGNGYGFTLEGFLTRLQDTFVLEEVGVDEEGNLILERRNGSGSTVAGGTAEIRFIYGDRLEMQSGLTVQQSRYDEPVFWSAELPGTRRYLRTPDIYGFYMISGKPLPRFVIALSGVLTGPMDVPHLAGAIERDELIRSRTFLETNVRASYEIRLPGAPDVELFGGLQNVTNAYQRDFDVGKYRDSNFIYGPARPRTVFMGVKTRF